MLAFISKLRIFSALVLIPGRAGVHSVENESQLQQRKEMFFSSRFPRRCSLTRTNPTNTPLLFPLKPQPASDTVR